MESELTLSQIWFNANFQLVAMIIFTLGFFSGLYWHNILFKKDDSESSVYANTDIEYLSHCNRYFPRIKGKYLFWWPSREMYTLQNDADRATYTTDLESAESVIKKYLEQERLLKTEIITPKL